MPPSPSLNIAVMGGSLGGLNAALHLRAAGHRVTVYERARAPLTGRGAGIVLSPYTVRYLLQSGGAAGLAASSVAARRLRYLAADGTIADEQPVTYRFGSYDAIYRALLTAFGRDDYRLDANIVDFAADADGVTLRTAAGTTARADLLVCADGILSTARQLLAVRQTADYAGYIAWRGTLARAELAAEEFALFSAAIVYHVQPVGHILVYPIPIVDEQADAPQFAINWLWYRNVPAGAALTRVMTDRHGQVRHVSLPPGAVADDNLRDLRAAAADELPPVLADLVRRTAEPFVQAVIDVQTERMIFGAPQLPRICLLGDAAFAARPHAAAGTAKAAEDGWQLCQALSDANGALALALPAWEQRQLALGRDLVARARRAGEKLQTGGWPVGAPLPFGLYAVGDSTLG